MHLAYIWIVSHLSAKNYQNWWKFDEVMTKTNLLSFFWDTVYMNGYQYFEQMKRFMPRSDDPCSSKNKNCSVLVAHNNWIYTIEAKVYRFREHLMWLYDGNDQYYSSNTRKYLMYTNPKPPVLTNLTYFDKRESIKRQVSDLRTALSVAYLLKRFVILPIFYCNAEASDCPLNSLVQIKHFDVYFSNSYRESSFLQHPKVTDAVKRGILYLPLLLYITPARLSSSNKLGTIASDSVANLFTDSKDKVINIGELNGIHLTFSNHTDSTFSERIRMAFKLSDYRQHELGEFL